MPFRLELEQAGVKTREFAIGWRDIRHPWHPWMESNFFQVFIESEFDIVQTARAGHPEFPYVHIKKPIVEWNVFAAVDHSPNIVKTVCICEWILEQWLEHGGPAARASVAFPGIEPSVTSQHLRNELGIPRDAIVIGLHQRRDDNIYSSIPLQTFYEARKRTEQDIRFVLLNGSGKYRQQAADLGIPLYHLPETAKWVEICKFLNTLDIYAHGRADGESHSSAIEEAMLHGLPVVSHKAIRNGHVPEIGEHGKVCDTFEEYVEFLLQLIENEQLRKRLGAGAKARAVSDFLISATVRKFEALYPEVYREYCTPEFVNSLNCPPPYFGVERRLKLLLGERLYCAPSLRPLREVIRFIRYIAVKAQSSRVVHNSTPYALDEAYDEQFFLDNIKDSRPMAEYLAPKLFKALGIRRMIDMGCATGHWVSAFLRCGVDAIGVEGSSNARRHLLCPEDRVIFADLRKPLKFRFREDVDLVLSLEVAEHIETRYADVFVENIVKYNPKWVIMTAAPPGQGGVQHVNEQLPEYWIDKFAKREYEQDLKTQALISQFVDEGRKEAAPPLSMRRDDISHEGVWILPWMPRNLLAFRSKI